MTDSISAETGRTALHWEDLPLIVVSSVVQAAVVGLVVGFVLGGILSLFGLGHTLGNLRLVAPIAGTLFFFVLVAAGLKPERTKEILLELPKAHRPD